MIDDLGQEIGLTNDFSLSRYFKRVEKSIVAKPKIVIIFTNPPNERIVTAYTTATVTPHTHQQIQLVLGN